jgi:uncharacterized membrane protein YeaQ/YmgE (transglycosylase-associated protein family)
MVGVGWFSALIIGMLAGWIAERVFNRRHGILTNLAVGLVGSMIGGFVARRLHLHIGGGFVDSLIVSSIGAVILLAPLNLANQRR